MGVVTKLILLTRGVVLFQKHNPIIYLCNRKNRVALVMLTGTWLFAPMMEGSLPGVF
jgi:hypothetical protein